MYWLKIIALPVLGVVILGAAILTPAPQTKKEPANSPIVGKIEGVNGILVSGDPSRAFMEPKETGIGSGNLVEDAVSNNLIKGFVPDETVSPEILAKHTADPIIPLRIALPDLPDVLEPTTYEGVLEILELLKGFGELISSPDSQLSQEFRDLDAKILAKTREVYRNPHQTLGGAAFILGEQCGLSGGAFSFPPGHNDLITACGGTPPIGGTEGAPFVSGNTCNTNPACYFSGFCFLACYSYTSGSHCYCWVPSCYGVCGNGAYLWDSVTGICGCAGGGGGISSLLSSIGSGLLSSLSSSLGGGISSVISDALSSTVLDGLSSGGLESLGSGILSGLGSSFTSGLSTSLVQSTGPNLLNSLSDGALNGIGQQIGSTLLQTLGISGASNLGLVVGTGILQNIGSGSLTSIINDVLSGQSASLTSDALITSGQQIGAQVLNSLGTRTVSGLGGQVGSSIVNSLGSQVIQSIIDDFTNSFQPTTPIP